MAKRLQRIEVGIGLTDWSLYHGKELNIVCHDGTVWHGILIQSDTETLYLKDMAGNRITLNLRHVEEILLDFTTNQ